MNSDAILLRSMKRRQAAALAALLLLVVIGHVLLSVVFNGMNDDAHVINMSGRQRMLAQKTTALNFEIALGGGQAYRDELSAVIQSLSSIFDSLFHTPQLHPVSPAINELLNSGTPSLEKAAQDFFIAEKAIVSNGSVDIDHARSIRRHVADVLVPLLDQSVMIYQRESEKRLEDMRLKVLLADTALVIILIMSWIFVFKPLIRSLKEEFRAVEKANELHTAMLNAALDAIITIDSSGRIISFNRSAEDTFKCKAEAVIGQDIAEIIIPQRHRDAHRLGMMRMSRGEAPRVIGHRMEMTAINIEGCEFPVELTITALNNHGSFTAFIRDLTEVKKSQQTINLLSTSINNSPLSVVITDLEGLICFTNQTFSTISGYSADEVFGKHVRILKSGMTPNETYEDLWATLIAGEVWRGELINRAKNGEVYYEQAIIFPALGDTGTISNYIAVKEDVTQKRENARKLSYLENFDELTGLINRQNTFHTINEKLDHTADGEILAIGVVKIADFDAVTRTFGHNTSDKLILTIVDTLKTILGNNVILGRLESDGFAYVQPNIRSRSIAEATAAQILKAINQPQKIGNDEFRVSANIGISFYPEDEKNSHELVRHAVTAAVNARIRGLDGFRVFIPDMDRESIEAVQIERELRHAIDNGDLVVHYQPLIDSHSSTVAGAEALVRWTSPTFGPLPPDRFIALAEAKGLIKPLGSFVMRQACKDAALFQAELGDNLVMAINIAAQQIEDMAFSEHVAASVAEFGLSADLIELEVTERSLISKSHHVLAQIELLRSLGHGLSIDDFGTGYSALSYLRQYPFTTLKVDQSFVRQLGKDEEGTNLVKAIVRMAQALNLEVVAEGVENADQEAFLRAIGVHRLQGYRFARPMPADRFVEYLHGGTVYTV